MKTFKNLSTFVLLVFAIFAFSSCRGETINEDAVMESVFPEESEVIFVVDTHKKTQVENFKTLAGFFPDFTEEGTSFSFLEYYFPFVPTGALEEELSEFLQNPLKIGLAIGEGVANYESERNTVYALEDDFTRGSERGIMKRDFPPSDLAPADSTWGQPQEISLKEVLKNPIEEDTVIVIQSEKAGVIENLLMEIVEEEDVFDFEEKNRVKYWHYAEAEGAIVKYTDIIFATGTDKGVKRAVERLNAGETFFEKEEEVEYLAYVYTKGIEDVGVSGFSGYPGFTGYGIMYVIAESDGVRTKTKMEFLEEEIGSEKIVAQFDYDFGLADKIGSDEVIFYSENANLLISIDMFTDLLPNDFDLGIPAAFVGMTGSEFRDLLDSPFAFVVSKTDDFIPAFGLYLDVAGERKYIAEDAVSALDEYLEEVVDEFDVIIEEIYGQDVGGDVLEKRQVTLGGETLQKIVFNLSDYLGAEYSGLGDLEFYYGVTFDDVLVIALHPSFEDVYGVDTISEGDIFDKIFENVSEADDSIIYFDFALFLDVLEGVLDFEGGGVDGNFTGDIFELLVKPFLMPLEFAVGSSYYRDGYLWSEIFVAMEEVEVDMADDDEFDAEEEYEAVEEITEEALEDDKDYEPEKDEDEDAGLIIR